MKKIKTLLAIALLFVFGMSIPSCSAQKPVAAKKEPVKTVAAAKKDAVKKDTIATAVVNPATNAELKKQGDANTKNIAEVKTATEGLIGLALTEDKTKTQKAAATATTNSATAKKAIVAKKVTVKENDRPKKGSYIVNTKNKTMNYLQSDS